MAEKPVASPAVGQLKALLHDQPHNPMRPNVKEYHKEELKRLEDIMRAPSFIMADRGFASKKRNEIMKLLDAQSPKKIEEPARLDAVTKLATEVLEKTIKPAMLTHEEMRRNPVGSVDGFLRRENAPVIKDAILAWKRAMWALEPDNPDIDYTNMEKHRRSATPEGAATFMANAQIPGNFAMTPTAKDNWPLGEPTADTVLKQVQRTEASRKAVQARWAKRDAKLVARAAREAKKIAVAAASPQEEG